MPHFHPTPSQAPEHRKSRAATCGPAPWLGRPHRVLMPTTPPLIGTIHKRQGSREGRGRARMGPIPGERIEGMCLTLTSHTVLPKVT